MSVQVQKYNVLKHGISAVRARMFLYYKEWRVLDMNMEKNAARLCALVQFLSLIKK
jgi:hypothetical protein